MRAVKLADSPFSFFQLCVTSRWRNKVCCAGRLSILGGNLRRQYCLSPEELTREMGGKWRVVVKELKMVSYVAAPMVAVTVLQYLLQVVSLMMVGHLDELSLSGVSVAASFTSVTGFSLLFGMAGASETLCGQAYGAEQYQKLGIYTYTSIISLFLVCIPISLLWLFTDKLLILIGQDHSISIVAHKYSLWLIPGLFSYAILQSLVRYFQAQSLILPMLFTSCATLCLHIPLCWALVFKVNLRSAGAALAIGLSYWLNVFLLGLYMKYSSACEKTRVVFSKEVFLSMKEFFRLAIPSAGMVCLEWWSYEVLILLSGLLPNPKTETSVLSICFAFTYLHYYVPYSFGATASTRVSNELGAGNPHAAKVAVKAIMVLAVAEMLIVSMILFFCRHLLGYAFSKETEIVDRITDMGPLMCLSIITDGLQAVLSGVARGSGWQHIGAYVNLGAYYLVGTPLGAVLAFVVHLRGKGLWVGLLTGSTVQAILLALRTIFTDWQKQASKARERTFEGDSELRVQS
ncbi:MATE efflux family protein 7 [Morella rubra]|uniref:Protein DETOXIFICATION n=1 Tax=Morella rubra TaxID=262757 RepID=A0A6A1VGG8_9ROSI|nr:MATE efflux family protein 7 [Morella rubra]